MNILFGWGWIFLGFISGAVIGILFHKENWLGGYGSHARRFVRLGHISFLGLGILNILFGLTAPILSGTERIYLIAAWSFILGGVAMPLACGLMAIKHTLRAAFVFFAPVTFLMTGTFFLFYLFTQK